MSIELTERQKKYREYYEANREYELMRKATKTSVRHVLKEVLDCWEKQGIPENKWNTYENACSIIGRIPRTCFKIMAKENK
jgi:hypothetical protein